MQRRERPMVPAPNHTPMPDKSRSKHTQGKLYSLYMRPWVLNARWSTRAVPYICDLSLVVPEDPQIRHRLKGKQAQCIADVSYYDAWLWYIKGHVVSHHQKRIIVQFMTSCCGKSTTKDREEQEKIKKENSSPANEVALKQMHAILDAYGGNPRDVQEQDADSSDENGDDSKNKKDKEICNADIFQYCSRSLEARSGTMDSEDKCTRSCYLCSGQTEWSQKKISKQMQGQKCIGRAKLRILASKAS